MKRRSVYEHCTSPVFSQTPVRQFATVLARLESRCTPLTAGTYDPALVLHLKMDEQSVEARRMDNEQPENGSIGRFLMGGILCIPVNTAPPSRLTKRQTIESTAYDCASTPCLNPQRGVQHMVQQLSLNARRITIFPAIY
jgi:hypothetical protein